MVDKEEPCARRFHVMILVMNTPTVSLFIPCLVDQVYPEIGFSMAWILERLGYRVTYDPRQTCCGQPAFNAGHRHEALAVAGRFVDLFAEKNNIVCPSGSCTGMVRNYYSNLFGKDPRGADVARLAAKVFEFSEFVVREDKLKKISGNASGCIGFHNSCHSYRELRIDSEPRSLLERISGFEAVEVQGEPTCCGFGGLFCVKFKDIAAAMAKSRLEKFIDNGVDVVVANDPGCVFHLRQEVEAKGYPVQIRHLTEFIAQAMGFQMR